MTDIHFDFLTDPQGPHGISYKSWLEREKLALVVIDVQNYITQRRYSGMWTADGGDDYYYKRLEEVVLPNLKRLIEYFRNRKIKAVYTRIASFDNALADVPGMSRKVLARELFDVNGTQYHLFHEEDASRIDERVAPGPQDLVVPKTASGAFCSSELVRVLRDHGLLRLVFAGGLTDACVASSVREAYDLGFLCTVVEDACIAPSAEDHNAALRSLGKYYAWVTVTEELLRRMRNMG